MQGHPDSGSCPHSAVCYVHSLSCPDQVWGCPNPRERRTQAHLESGEEGAQCTASGLNTGGLHHRDKDKGVGALPAAQSRGAASRPPTEASPYPPSTPLTASYGEEPAGHRGDDLVAHVEALGVDLSHLTSGNQVFGNGDVLGLLPGPKWEHWLLPAPGRVCRPLPWVLLGTVASWGCSCSPTP